MQILCKDRVIGQFSAEKRKIKELTVYQSNSTVTATLIRVQISYQIKVVLRNGVLEESDLKLSVNGKLRTHSQTKKDSNTYIFVKNGKGKGKVEQPITHTTIMLYFDEPIGIGKTYSEEEGNFCKILTSEPDTYQKINAKGKKNTYHYNGNSLRHLLIENTLMNFEMMADIPSISLSKQSTPNNSL